MISEILECERILSLLSWNNASEAHSIATAQYGTAFKSALRHDMRASPDMLQEIKDMREINKMTFDRLLKERIREAMDVGNAQEAEARRLEMVFSIWWEAGEEGFERALKELEKGDGVEQGRKKGILKWNLVADVGSTDGRIDILTEQEKRAQNESRTKRKKAKKVRMEGIK